MKPEFECISTSNQHYFTAEKPLQSFTFATTNTLLPQCHTTPQTWINQISNVESILRKLENLTGSNNLSQQGLCYNFFIRYSSAYTILTQIGAFIIGFSYTTHAKGGLITISWYHPCAPTYSSLLHYIHEEYRLHAAPFLYPVCRLPCQPLPAQQLFHLLLPWTDPLSSTKMYPLFLFHFRVHSQTTPNFHYWKRFCASFSCWWNLATTPHPVIVQISWMQTQ